MLVIHTTCCCCTLFPSVSVPTFIQYTSIFCIHFFHDFEKQLLRFGLNGNFANYTRYFAKDKKQMTEIVRGRTLVIGQPVKNSWQSTQMAHFKIGVGGMGLYTKCLFNLQIWQIYSCLHAFNCSSFLIFLHFSSFFFWSGLWRGRIKREKIAFTEIFCVLCARYHVLWL